jgi:hypothetical protein
MAAKATCIVTQSNEGKGAYGIRIDTDESVYFPFSVSEALQLEEFEEVEAILLKNDRAEPAWKAIRARYLDEIDGGGLSA